MVGKAFVCYFLMSLMRDPMTVQINQSSTEVTSLRPCSTFVDVEISSIDRRGLKTLVFRKDIEGKQIAGGAFEAVVDSLPLSKPSI
jgi:hypothetical protein